jgi:hypothetical protein
MAKIRAAGKRKAATPGAEFQKYSRAVPCLIVIIGIFAAVFAVLYFSMQSAGR